MKRMKLVIDIDEELFNYIQEEKNDKHLDQRFDYKIRHSIKNGIPLQTVFEKIREEIMNKGMIPTHTYITPDGKALQKSVVDVVIDKHIAELEEENKMEK